MKKNLLITIILILVVWLIVLSFSLVQNHSTSKSPSEIKEYNVTGFSTDFTKVIDSNKSSIVSLNQNEVYSTGFIYSSDNGHVYIVTSYHGVSEGEDVMVNFNSGVSTLGKVIGHDSFCDVAVIDCEFPYEVRTLILGDATLLNDGEFILSIGTSSSMEYDFSSAFGMISSKYREIENNISFDEENYNYYLGIIQLNGEFVNGYSGAPILNMNGEAIGMITMEDDGKVLAVTINEINIVAQKIINNEEYSRIDFGLKGKYLKDLENYETTSLNIGLEVTDGYYVVDVLPTSFASTIGINKGDVIIRVNDIEIMDFASFLDVIYSNATEFDISLIRNGELLSLKGNLYD